MNEMKDEVIVINSTHTQIKVADMLEIDQTDLVNEYSKQAAVYGWVGKILADAENRQAQAKARREEVMADLDQHYRDELAGTKYTEAVITANVKLDSDYSEVDDALRRAEHEQRQLRLMHDALKMRADMLVSLGAHLRMEYEMTGMRTMDGKTNKLKKSLREQV